MEPWEKSLNFIFPTKYVIPKSLKFSHWPSQMRIWYSIPLPCTSWKLKWLDRSIDNPYQLPKFHPLFNKWITPWKINMEPENGGLEDKFPLFYVPCEFSRGYWNQSNLFNQMYFSEWRYLNKAELRVWPRRPYRRIGTRLAVLKWEFWIVGWEHGIDIWRRRTRDEQH